MFRSDSIRQALIAASAVTQMAVLIVVSAWLGDQLDRQVGTSPWVLLAFTGLGFAGGLYRLHLALQPLQEDDEPPNPTP